MATRSSRPVTVTLGELGERAEARVRSGDYASLSEVLRAGLRALDREDRAFEAQFDPAKVRALVQEALDDPRPPVPIE